MGGGVVAGADQPATESGAQPSSSSTAPASATPATPAERRLEQRVDELERRLRAVEGTAASSEAPAGDATTPRALHLGAYGELKFGTLQNPAANGQWQTGFDGGRLTLLPSYQFSDSTVMKAEVEFEHGGIGLADDDKLNGTVEVEQAYIDVALDDHLHWRLPGIDVVAFGYTNLNHEPILFYSVERPELETSIVPSTWFEGATSIHGWLAGPISYQFQVSTSVVDDGGNANDTTAAKTPSSGGYPPGIDGHHGLALSRGTVSGFSQLNDALGYALRLSSTLPGLPGFAGSLSAYWTPTVTPRSAYASDASGNRLGSLGSCALTMIGAECRYRPGDRGLELRAETVAAFFSHPRNLRANNDGDPTDNVGRSMWGWSVEAACHLALTSRNWDLVPFYRYSTIDLQTGGVSGRDATTENGQGFSDVHTLGVALLPHPEWIIKLDYQTIHHPARQDAHADHLLGGVGFFF